eukprot:scaffold1954_cov268-Pinguiococcus_pyrenoidosus.AAC.289
MSEDMQQDAVDCASQALEKYNIEKVGGVGRRRNQAASTEVDGPYHRDAHPTGPSPIHCRTSPPSSRRSSTRSTTRHGTASWDATSGKRNARDSWPRRAAELMVVLCRSYVTHETKHFIYFYLGQVAILLFKSG